MKRSGILLWTATALTLIMGHAPLAAAAGSCAKIFENSNLHLRMENWKKLNEHSRILYRKRDMRSRSKSAELERRPVAQTSGERKDAVADMDPADIRIDSADPSQIMMMEYPDGTKKYRINFSGLRFIEANRPEDLMRPGIKKVQKSRGFYKDGTEMVGAYHNEAWAWDVVTYKNDRGEWIALGGVMEQPKRNKLPNVATHNPTRSRWWGKVSHVRKSNGAYEEHIEWQGPVHDFNRDKHQGWKYHGYGGTLVTDYNPVTGIHEPIKLNNGNYILVYERVTAERNGQPWVTTTFMREMDPSLTTTVGKEINVTNLKSPVTGKYFKALRRGSTNALLGWLREGDNVLKIRDNQQFIKVGSGNDYVGQYGIVLDYRDPGTGPLGPYKNAVDKHGELIDFATTMKLRELFNATWMGRPQLNYVQGKLWLHFHYVDRSSIPANAPHVGWPSSKDFPHYGRITASIPVKIVYDKRGQPLLEKDIDPKWAFMYE